MQIPVIMGAIDISKYVELSVFKSRVDQLFDIMKACPPAPGFQGVMIPGEIEYNMTQANIKDGIELSDAVMRDFKELAREYDVPFNI